MSPEPDAPTRVVHCEETWNAPRYRSYHWDSSENDTCSMRRIGRGC